MEPSSHEIPPRLEGDAPPPEAAPLVLDGKYRLDAHLGEGASGVVYRALHLGLKKSFALKLLKAGVRDGFALARFRREAEALGRLRHPHVVEVTDFGVDPAAGGVPYLVMELLEGTTLAVACREQGPLPLDRALPLLEAIAAAVDAAHAQGVLHRDLKPGNILLGTDADGGPLVKVVDFGLARATSALEDPIQEEAGSEELGGSLTWTAGLLGTPLYAAPELIRQEAASRASDLYSFGVLAYELIAGHPPFEGTTAAVLAGHLRAEPPVPRPRGKALPEPVWQALREPLRKDPAARPASAGEAVRRLRQAAEQAAEQAETARWRAEELPRRAGLAAGLTAVLLLAGAFLPGPAVPPLERALHDLRMRAAPAVPPDPRILLLTADEASLRQGGRSLTDRADEFGRVLERVFAAGAQGVAIDLLLHPRWSESAAFSELVLRHPEALTLAAFSKPDGRVIGTECVAGLTAAALGPERTLALFGFVNLGDDPDGVTRRGRLSFRDVSGGTRPSWSARAARALDGEPGDGASSFWVDARIDWRRYARLSWRDVPAALERDPGLFRGRLVLVGGEFLGSGDDYHRVPARAAGAGEVSGLTLQALLVDTLARGGPVRQPGSAVFLSFIALLAGPAVAGILCARRSREAAGWLAVAVSAVGLYVAVSFAVFRWAGLMLPISSPLALVLPGCLLAFAFRGDWHDRNKNRQEGELWVLGFSLRCSWRSRPVPARFPRRRWR